MATVNEQGQFIEPLVFEGGCTKAAPCSGDGQCGFSKGGRVKEVLRKARCLLLYLPPYSPQLNLIERCWPAIKCKGAAVGLGNGFTPSLQARFCRI